MGLFNFWGNYDKPGPGVSKDELPKAAPIRFFEIFGRKFTKLLQLNMIFMLPVLVVAVLMGCLYLFFPHVVFQMATASGTLVLDVWNLYVVPLPLLLLSPFVAGLTFVTRNFAREEHAFVWSDFWSAVKNNWKYFFLNGVVIYLLYFILSFALIYYYNNAVQNVLLYVPFWLCIVVAVVFLFAQYYIPVMFVTFDLKFGQVYKNAFIFVLAGFGRNLLVTAIFALLIVGILFIPVMPLTILLLFLLVVFLLFSFIRFLINFAIYPVIDQYLIQPYQRKLAEEKAGSNEGRRTDLKETFPELFKAPAEETPAEDKYVYVNGKLVKQSKLEEQQKDGLE